MLIVPSGWVPAGEQAIADLSSSTSLTVPDGADTAIVYFRTQDVHINFDGVTATTGDAAYPASNFLIMENARTAMKGLRMIESAASATAAVWYFNVMGG